MFSSKLLHGVFSMILCFLLFVPFMSCQANSIPFTTSKAMSQQVSISQAPHIYRDGSSATTEQTPIDRPETSLSLRKRRAPIRPSASKPYPAPETIHTFRLFNIDLVNADSPELERALLKIVKSLLRTFPDVLAAALVGVQLDRRHLRLRLGALRLDIMSLTQALTQGIVLAVMKRLAMMMSRGFLGFGAGEVMVGAGVRILFAVGIRLRGLRNMIEDVQGLIG